MLSQKTPKQNYWTTASGPKRKQGTPRFPNICRNVGSLAVMASVLKENQQIQILGPLIHVSFYSRFLEISYLLGFGSLSKKRTGPFVLLPCRSRTICEWWLLQSKKRRKQIMPNPNRSPHFHGLCGQSARIGQGGRYLEIIRAVCPVSVKAIISLPQTQLMLACCLDF